MRHNTDGHFCGGLRHSVTHPLFLLEPLLLLLTARHCIGSRAWPPPRRAALATLMFGAWLLFTLAFLLRLPWLRAELLPR